MINLCRASKLEIDEWSNFNSIMEPWAADPGKFFLNKFFKDPDPVSD